MTTQSDDLVTVLEDLGVDVFKVHGDEINGKCPVHYKVKGRESTRNSWYLNIDTGLWHCFTCGARGNLSQLLSELAADPGVLWNAQSIIITQGLRRLTPEESNYDPYVREDLDWNTYFKFPALPQSIIDFRKFDPEVALRFGVRWNPDVKASTAPIVSPLGELRGWQEKKAGWVNNVPEGVNKSTTLFGIERAFGSTALIVESPLDVVRFHSVYGGSDINCVSSFGANVSDKQINLLAERFDKLIIALDNDKAGVAETKRLVKLMPSFRGGPAFFWNYAPDDPKDIGEMTDGQIMRGLSNVSRVWRRV